VLTLPRYRAWPFGAWPLIGKYLLTLPPSTHFWRMRHWQSTTESMLTLPPSTHHLSFVKIKSRRHGTENKEKCRQQFVAASESRRLSLFDPVKTLPLGVTRETRIVLLDRPACCILGACTFSLLRGRSTGPLRAVAWCILGVSSSGLRRETCTGPSPGLFSCSLESSNCV